MTFHAVEFEHGLIHGFLICFTNGKALGRIAGIKIVLIPTCDKKQIEDMAARNALQSIDRQKFQPIQRMFDPYGSEWRILLRPKHVEVAIVPIHAHIVDLGNRHHVPRLFYGYSDAVILMAEHEFLPTVVADETVRELRVLGIAAIQWW